MAFTYTGDPANNPIDAVRFRTGDTDPDNPKLTDEEIQYLLDQHNGNVLMASIDSIERTIATMVEMVDYTIGPESVKNSQKLTNYRRLLSMLKSEATGNGTPIWTGSNTDKHRLRPIFDIGMHDNNYLGPGGIPDGSCD